jgi:hypothetical protein
MGWDGVGWDGMGWDGMGQDGIGVTASAELVCGYSVHSTTYRHTAEAELHELDVDPKLLIERREHAHLRTR